MSILLRGVFLFFLTLFPVSISLAETVFLQGLAVAIDETEELMWTYNPQKARPWAAQTTAAANSETLGFDDWRLPTSAELLALENTNYVPQIDPRFRLGYSPRNWTLWSSDEVTNSSFILSSRAYAVFFDPVKKRSLTKYSYHPTLFVRSVSGACYLKCAGGEYLLCAGSDLISGD